MKIKAFFEQNMPTEKEDDFPVANKKHRPTVS